MEDARKLPDAARNGREATGVRPRVFEVALGKSLEFQAPKSGSNLGAGRRYLLADAATSLKVSASDLVE
jgi:hypothetical protein